MKDTFVFHRDWYDGLRCLDPQLKAELIEAIIQYGLNGLEIELSDTAKMLFGFIRSKMERDAVKYDEIIEKRREAGRRGGLQRVANQVNQANQANACDVKQIKQVQANQANQADMLCNDMICNDNIEKKENNKLFSQKKRFIPPTVEQVMEYCLERCNNVDAQKFIDFYEANGWVQGRGKPIKDWKAAVRTWEQREKTQTNLILKPQSYENNNTVNEAERARVERERDCAEQVAELLSTMRPVHS